MLNHAFKFLAVMSAILASQAVAGSAERTGRVAYRISPVFDGKTLSEIAVEVRLQADKSGETMLELPDQYGGVKDHWHYLSPLVATGATITAPTEATRLLRSAPNARITIRYHVRSAYKSDPDASGGNAYNGAIVRPDWFASLGEFIFITPKGSEKASASLAWAGWPRSWVTASSATEHASTVEDVAESSLIAGPDVAIQTRSIKGGALKVATRGRFDWDISGYADQVAAIITAQRSFWNEADGNYTVILFQLAPSPGSSSTGGTGRAHGFVQYASPDTRSDILFRIIAHEHMHNWIPRRIGEDPETEKDAAAVFWLSEGFTDLYTARTLLRAGLWTPQQFVDDLNRTLAGLASSSARTYPNSRIVADFWNDPAVGQLPYDRGHLFALLLDAELRRNGKPGLDAVIFAMRDRWLAAPSKAKPAIIDNLLVTLDAQMFDARPLIDTYIDAGKPIALPADLFGGCANIVETAIPVFKPGFDRDATAAAGAFAGVDPQGAAYRAGLRNGMKRLARLGGQEGDSRVPLSYRVTDNAGDRTISWLPAGGARIDLQEARLSPERASIEAKECSRRLSGLE